MSNHWKTQLPNFELYSYYAGITAAFSEIVGAGVKKLALSHPYSAEELHIMREPSKQIAAEYSVLTRVEDDLLVTPLFPADVALGKHVIFFIKDEMVWEKYQTLKHSKMEPEALGWAFGHLLSYDDASIQKMLGH